MMRRVVPRHLSESAIYGLGGALSQAAAIILVPIYVPVLGRADYGVVAVINATISLSVVTATLALPQAFFRWYLKESETAQERDNVVAATMFVRVIASGAAALIMLLLAAPLVALLGIGFDQLPAFVVIAPIVFFDSLNQIPLSFLRARRKPAAYVVVAFGRAILGSILIVVGVVVLRLGPLGLVLGSAAASIVAATAGLVVLYRSGVLRLHWDRNLTRAMLGFSLPLVPAAAAGWALNLSDRYILQAMRGEAVVGVYSLGYTVGFMINAFAVAPFTLAWGAAYWEMAKQDGVRRTFSRIMTGFVAAASVVALGLSAFGTDAIRLFVADFEPGRYVVPFSAFAYVLYGVYTIGATGLNLESQTRWLPLTLATAAIANVLLNLALIPPFGFVGAAIATLASYVVLAVLTTAVSQRYYAVPWEYWRVGSTLILGFVLGEAALLGPDLLIWRIACFVAYVPLLLLARVVSFDELSSLASVLSRGRIGSRPTAAPD
jgi:O-antigen/teichoic acid export membrane protein